MNPAYSAISRETETLRCCGNLYRRWRFAGRHFSRQHIKRCKCCGAWLAWNPNYRPVDRLKTDRERQLRRRIAFTLGGLRTDGKPRSRFFLSNAERGERNRAKYHRRAKQNFAAGLTSRGTRRIHHPRILPIEQRWREERATMNVSRPEILPHLEREEAA